MSKQYVMINPTSIFEKISTHEIVLKVNNDVYKLSGNRIERFFIPYIEYYISPILLDKLKSICDCPQSDGAFDFMINELILKEILIFYFDRSEKLIDSVEVLCINYNNFFSNENLYRYMDKNINVTIINDFDSISDKKYDVVIFSVWRWNSLVYKSIFEKILNRLSFDTIVLPVVLNDNYFSIGPHCKNDDNSSKYMMYNHLDNEESRSLYYFQNHNLDYYGLFYTILIKEIKNIYKNYKCNKIVKMNTLGRILSFNFNSFKLNKKKIR